MREDRALRRRALPFSPEAEGAGMPTGGDPPAGGHRRVKKSGADIPLRERVARGVMRAEAARQEAARDRRLLVTGRSDRRVVLPALATALFTIFGLALASAKPGGTPPSGWMPLAALFAAAGLLFTLALPRLLGLDAPLMALVHFLCSVSFVLLMTVSPQRGVRQAVFTLAGLPLMLLISSVVRRMPGARGFGRAAIPLGLVLLLLPLLFGETVNGARSWLELPFAGSFQPSEMTKLCLILVLAEAMSGGMAPKRVLLALLFAAGCVFLLMLQRDLGTALIYYLTALLLFYAAGGRWPLTLLGLLGGAGGALLGYRMFPHVRVRVAMWRNPWSDPTGSGYQIIQALLAIGSGGLFGVGLGQGAPERIPEYATDFIFAVACEQLGQVFGMLLLAAYALLMVRGAMIAVRQRDPFGMLLGAGATASLGVQTFMILAGVIKLLPLTGVTMPFLSYGGSSLLSCLGMAGILHGLAARERDALAASLADAGETKAPDAPAQKPKKRQSRLRAKGGRTP